jgi:Spy/CpxP family protein refolding chaperone
MKPQFALKLSLLSLGLALSARISPAQDTSSAPPPAPPTGAPDAAPADGAQPPPPPPEHHRGHGFVLEELTKKLGLTPDQQKQVGDIIKAGREQMKALHDDDSMSDEDKRAKMKEDMADTKAQIRAVLTAEQQKIFDTLPTRGPRPQNPPPADAPTPTPPPSTT